MGFPSKEQIAPTGSTTKAPAVQKEGFWFHLRRDLKKNPYIYLLLLPVIAYYLIFMYQPMYGAQIAFKQYSPGKGIWQSSWVGFQHFTNFFNSYYFIRLLRNTLLLNVYNLAFGFPAPIILALLINEVKNSMFKRTVQTVTYLPHFISIVVICGIIVDFSSKDGLINTILAGFGVHSIPFLTEPSWFRTIYISSGIWQEIGWGSIIYLSALASIDPQLYEACMVDGAGRFKQLWHVTLPGIVPTIIIMFILRMGRMMNVGADKVLLLYNPVTYETADVISTFVYRKGMLESNFSYSTAVGLFNSVINFSLLIGMNRLSRKFSETSLW